MGTHENDTELDVAYWEGRAEEAKNCSDMLATKHERIAALEAELQPWRQMARQLEALRGKGFNTEVHSDRDTDYYYAFAFNSDGVVKKGKGKDWPAAVAAAYGEVVGDE